jgi:hypothetical protein
MSLSTFGLSSNNLRLATAGVGLYPQAIAIANDLIVAATLSTRVRAYASAELYARVAADLLVQVPQFAIATVEVRTYANPALTAKTFAQLSISRKDD